jgi:hypothetical protein
MSTTGGNSKSSSPSDDAYWARAKASNYAETHKARRVKRHAKRMAKKVARRGAWEARKAAKRATRPFSEAA